MAPRVLDVVQLLAILAVWTSIAGYTQGADVVECAAPTWIPVASYAGSAWVFQSSNRTTCAAPDANGTWWIGFAPYLPAVGTYCCVKPANGGTPFNSTNYEVLIKTSQTHSLYQVLLQTAVINPLQAPLRDCLVTRDYGRLPVPYKGKQYLASVIQNSRYFGSLIPGVGVSDAYYLGRTATVTGLGVYALIEASSYTENKSTGFKFSCYRFALTSNSSSALLRTILVDSKSQCASACSLTPGCSTFQLKTTDPRQLTEMIFVEPTDCELYTNARRIDHGTQDQVPSVVCDIFDPRSRAAVSDV